MGTPRKRWFGVYEEFAYQGHSDDVLATDYRITAFFNGRWARDGKTAEEACSCVIDTGDLTKLTNRRRVDRALEVAAGWCQARGATLTPLAPTAHQPLADRTQTAHQPGTSLAQGWHRAGARLANPLA
ncbi:MAG TPA: hypothetical protein VMH82_08860 [Myxococcota bacterium]|nr:hypothetical protein [Myxococcota bacterium]